MTNLLESTTLRAQSTENVDRDNLTRLQTNAKDLVNIAMKLTDSWGQAMFIMDQPLVENLFVTLGFNREVSREVYNSVRSLAYVQHAEDGNDTGPKVTWHAIDATCLTLRGIVGLGSSMMEIDDLSVEALLADNAKLFSKLMTAMPAYTKNLMFSPEVAATVMATFGASVSADKIYDLAATYGGQVTKDLEGRRGVSTQFIRSLTLTISARV